ncbi:MAG TPA: hypothetical protein VMY42_09580 [Thermoguttaceae bacterium]|nr:hypothetical protein [Thermoguttaceae bacterium]
MLRKFLELCRRSQPDAIHWLPESGAAGDDHPIVQGVRRKAGALLSVMANASDENPFDLPWSEFTRTALRLLDTPVPENARLMARAFSGGVIGEAIGAAANSLFLSGYDEQADSTSGWVGTVPARDFKAFNVFTLEKGARLGRIPRGGTAKHAAVELKAEGVKLARFGKQYVIDETDLIDSRDTVAAWLRPLQELGRAAKRVKGDLVYSLILENPTLAADNVPLFHGSHNNMSTAPLDVAALGAGVAAIAGQVLTDERNHTIHINLRAQTLIVTPPLWAAAREVESSLWIGQGEQLEIRPESRIGTAGLTDPVTEETRAGLATNWLLAAGPEGAPSIVVSYLNDQAVPRLRSRELSNGQWGVSYDIDHAVAAAAVDYRGVYFSTGAG